MVVSHTVTPISTRFQTNFLVQATLRPGTPGDAEACGHICYQAFKGIANEHNFPPDFPMPAVAINVVGVMLAHPGFYSVVAEQGGRVVGSNFLDERCPIAGLGPITVDPAAQDAGVGRLLVRDVLDRAESKGAAGIRLVQAAYHGRSLALYTKLGFAVREPLVTVQGSPIGKPLPGYRVRSARLDDLTACNAIFRDIHGHERLWELRDAVERGSARVVERDGQVTAYMTLLGFAGHAVARANDDLKALIATADHIHNPGFLLPSRNHDLLQWCIKRGLRIRQPMTLMTIGEYQEPRGPFLPSIAF